MADTKSKAQRLAGVLEAMRGMFLGDGFRTVRADEIAAELRRLDALVTEQRATIAALMAGMPEDGTTPVIRRIAALEAERDALRAEVERLRDAGTVAVREMGKLTRRGICEDLHHAKHDQHVGDATNCPVARRFCDARASLESAIDAARGAA